MHKPANIGASVRARLNNLVHQRGQLFRVLLDLPAPRLRAYRPETLIAEKLQAMVFLGRANSWMKDFYDTCELSRSHEFADDALARAIRATFDWRMTEVPLDAPDCLIPAFAGDPAAVAHLVLGADKAVRRATSDRLAIEIGVSVADLALDMGSGLLCCTQCPLLGGGGDEEPAKLGAVPTGAVDLVWSCPVPGASSGSEIRRARV